MSALQLECKLLWFWISVCEGGLLERQIGSNVSTVRGKGHQHVCKHEDERENMESRVVDSGPVQAVW